MKKQIENTLKSEPQAYVTLMIDYYGLYKKDEFPGWESAMSIVDKNERISYVERLMTLDIEEDIRYRFLANIQLHEFEGLLFSDSTVFPQIIPEEDLIGISELNNTITEFQNPEMINTTKGKLGTVLVYHFHGKHPTPVQHPNLCTTKPTPAK